jgi:hypothetical protein
VAKITSKLDLGFERLENGNLREVRKSEKKLVGTVCGKGMCRHYKSI